MVAAVVYAQIDDEAALRLPTILAGRKEWLEIVPKISQILQGTSRPGCRYIMLGWMKPQFNAGRSGLKPAAERDSSRLLNSKHVEPVSFYPYI